MSQCKSITEMTREDFAFFQIPAAGPAGMNCFRNLRGCKSSREGYIFEHLGFNRFAETDTKIPEDAKPAPVPTQDWVSQFFLNPAKRRLVGDIANLPERAIGKAYGIEDNGGMPFVCYVRDDAVSVFRRPHDGYTAEEDWTGDFEHDRLIYTEEVITFDAPVQTWIGIDDECQQHGNSILVHCSATKGKCLTATIKLDEARQVLQIVCTDLAGSEALSVEVAENSQVATLAKTLADHFHALCINCLTENGEEVVHDLPLKSFPQLTFKDATQSYVYIGSEIYSFDCVEAVTAYFSMMGNSSVPYPLALTAGSVLFMLDHAQVPRAQVAPHVVDGNWGDAYSVFYCESLTQTPLPNVKQLCPREM